MGNFDTVTQSTKDSINLSEIGDKPFTIVAVEDSPYTQEGKEPTAGVKISTVETWTTESGDEVQKIHTTRRAIVSKLTKDEFKKALAEGDTFKVKCPKEKTPSKSPNGLPYFDLIAVE